MSNTEQQSSESAPTCSKCDGTGRYYYGDTGTYRKDVEIVQPAFTEDVCDKCWGSGDEKNPGKDLNQPASENVAALSEEDRKRIINKAFELNEPIECRMAFRAGAEYEHRYMAGKQAAELDKLRTALRWMMSYEHKGDFLEAFFDLKEKAKETLEP